MKDQPTFFDFAAEVGLTKHVGGVEAPDRRAHAMRPYPSDPHAGGELLPR